MRTTILTMAVALAVGGGAMAQETTPDIFGASIYDWTGPYVGAQIGGAAGSVEHHIPLYGAIADGSADGWLLGSFAGYYHQSGNFVLGAELGVNWRDLSGRNSINNDPEQFLTRQQWDAALVGKVGLPTDRFLIYALGGVAMSSVSGQFVGSPLGGDSAITSDTVLGWTVGTGIEAPLGTNLRARLEYRYADFGQADLACGTCGPALITLSTHTVSVGLSYAF